MEMSHEVGLGLGLHLYSHLIAGQSPFADVTLIATFGDVHEHKWEIERHVHGLLLSQSPFLRRMMRGMDENQVDKSERSRPESKTLEIFLPGDYVCPQAVDTVLHFLYTGRVALVEKLLGSKAMVSDEGAKTVESVQDYDFPGDPCGVTKAMLGTLEVASYLELGEMAHQLVEKVVETLHPVNAVAVYSFARAHDVLSGEVLKEAAWAVITRSPHRVECMMDLGCEDLVRLATSSEAWFPSELDRLLVLRSVLASGHVEEEGNAKKVVDGIEELALHVVSSEALLHAMHDAVFPEAARLTFGKALADQTALRSSVLAGATMQAGALSQRATSGAPMPSSDEAPLAGAKVLAVATDIAVCESTRRALAQREATRRAELAERALRVLAPVVQSDAANSLPQLSQPREARGGIGHRRSTSSPSASTRPPKGLNGKSHDRASSLSSEVVHLDTSSIEAGVLPRSGTPSASSEVSAEGPPAPPPPSPSIPSSWDDPYEKEDEDNDSVAPEWTTEGTDASAVAHLARRVRRAVATASSFATDPALSGYSLALRRDPWERQGALFTKYGPRNNNVEEPWLGAGESAAVAAAAEQIASGSSVGRAATHLIARAANPSAARSVGAAMASALAVVQPSDGILPDIFGSWAPRSLLDRDLLPQGPPQPTFPHRTPFGNASTLLSSPVMDRVRSLPPARFGVELRGLLGDGVAESSRWGDGMMDPGRARGLLMRSCTTTSDPFFFAGSIWVIDGKRFLDESSGRLYVALYLRRLAPIAAAAAIAAPMASAPAGRHAASLLAQGLFADPATAAVHHARTLRGSGTTDYADLLDRASLGASPGLVARGLTPSSSLFVDPRQHVGMRFTLRLCGAPGSQTTQSVCGRSTMGKVFGTRAVEASWGWQTFLAVDQLCPHPTQGDGALHILITMELL